MSPETNWREHALLKYECEAVGRLFIDHVGSAMVRLGSEVRCSGSDRALTDSQMLDIAAWIEQASAAEAQARSLNRRIGLMVCELLDEPPHRVVGAYRRVVGLDPHD